MLDLFGFDDAATKPTVNVPKTLLNAALGFPEFWEAWPAGPRKVGKQQALDKWTTKECALRAEHIRLHVEWMKKQDDWLRGFIPMPCTYLNQQRWLDWEPVVERPREDPVKAILAHKGAPMPASVRERIAQLRKGMA